jgi:hypothetical protein
MTDPKGTISPARVDRRTPSSTAPAGVAWSESPVARVVQQCGQLVVCWSSLAEQAGHLLDTAVAAGQPSGRKACSNWRARVWEASHWSAGAMNSTL